MPRQLTPQELVLLETDTDYLNSGMNVWESRVINWNGTFVLIYRSQDQGYFATDITDFGQAKIAEIATKTDVHGMWYYLPQSMQETIAEEAETAVSVAKSAGAGVTEIARAAADAIGKTAADLIKPLIDTLMVPLIIGIAIGLIYLAKKG